MKDYKKELEDLIAIVIEEGASDLHLTAGRYPIIRVSDTLVSLNKKGQLSREDALGFVREMISEDQFEEFLTTREMDFSFAYKNTVRFRGNAFFQKLPSMLLWSYYPNELVFYGIASSEIYLG